MGLPLTSELKTARKLAGLTQVQLSDLSGVSQSVIAKLENDKVDPAYSTVAKLFAALENVTKNVKLVRDVMNRKPQLVSPSDSIELASSKMRKLGVSQLPIVSRNQLVGLVSESDVLTAIEKGLPRETPVKQVASPVPPVISSNAPASALSSILHFSPIVCVVDAGRVVGIVTRADLLGIF